LIFPNHCLDVAAQLPERVGYRAAHRQCGRPPACHPVALAKTADRSPRSPTHHISLFMQSTQHGLDPEAERCEGALYPTSLSANCCESQRVCERVAVIRFPVAILTF